MEGIEGIFPNTIFVVMDGCFTLPNTIFVINTWYESQCCLIILFFEFINYTCKCIYMHVDTRRCQLSGMSLKIPVTRFIVIIVTFFYGAYRNSAGFVYLRFETVEAAMAAQRAMHLRWFARRLISALFMVNYLYSLALGPN